MRCSLEEVDTMRNPIIAAVLSLIVAGLGQIYNGQITKGVLFIVAQLINGALTVILIGWIPVPIVGLWTVVRRYETRPSWRNLRPTA